MVKFLTLFLSFWVHNCPITIAYEVNIYTESFLPRNYSWLQCGKRPQNQPPYDGPLNYARASESGGAIESRLIEANLRNVDGGASDQKEEPDAKREAVEEIKLKNGNETLQDYSVFSLAMESIKIDGEQDEEEKELTLESIIGLTNQEFVLCAVADVLGKRQNVAETICRCSMKLPRKTRCRMISTIEKRMTGQSKNI